MNLNQIVIRDAEQEYESLALSLRAIAAAADVELDYDDLCAALGVSFAAVSTGIEPSPGWWMTYGRDLFLQPAARLFGFELRPIQPFQVGLGMVQAGEFAQHFEQSHKPLILRALENNQPVIAWQGWPDFRWPFWGVITGFENNQFTGTTIWTNGQIQYLTEPALQCYVVERCDPYLPPRDQLFAMSIGHAHAYMNQAPYDPMIFDTTPPTIVTGPQAFDAWENWFEKTDFKAPANAQCWNDHRQHAEFLGAARSSAARFLNRCRDVADPEQLEWIGSAIDCCESMVNRLAESRDEVMVQSLFSTYQSRQKLLETIHAAEADDRRLAMQIEQLAQ